MSARVYRDRLGRPITDPETIEARRLQELLRRATSRGIKDGRSHDEAVTVGELAAAAGLTPARVVEIVRAYQPAWLWGLTEAGTMDQWFVWEDGE